MSPLTIKLRTLTPIWTGGVETGKMDRVHETGIMGSLRWWYEAILRGLGDKVCDSTGETRCRYDPRKPGTPESQLCSACYLFGTTGWKRRFQLKISDENLLPAWDAKQALKITPYPRKRGWFLNPGQTGGFDMQLVGEPAALKKITFLLRFLENWGNLGPRPQLGYGVFTIENINGAEIKTNPRLDICGDNGVGELPDLRSFSFFKLSFIPKSSNWWVDISGLKELRKNRHTQKEWEILKNIADQGMVPVTPALRNYLRYKQKWSSSFLPHWLFGTLGKGAKSRSKVCLSWAYRQNNSHKWEVRGWVHLPDDVKGQNLHNEITKGLDRALNPPWNWFKGLGIETGFQYPAKLISPPLFPPWKRHSRSQVAELLNQSQDKEADI